LVYKKLRIRIKENVKFDTSVKEAIVGAAMNTTNGAYSAVLSTFSAYNEPHQQRR